MYKKSLVCMWSNILHNRFVAICRRLNRKRFFSLNCLDDFLYLTFRLQYWRNEKIISSVGDRWYLKCLFSWNKHFLNRIKFKYRAMKKFIYLVRYNQIFKKQFQRCFLWKEYIVANITELWKILKECVRVMTNVHYFYGILYCLYLMIIAI